MAGKVWAVLQHRDGKLHPMSREAVAAAGRIAALDGGAVEALLLGHGVGEIAAEAAKLDLAAVRTIDDQRLAAYTPGAYVGALAAAIGAAGEAAPHHVVFPHTYQTVDFLARLAQKLGAALVPDAIEIEASDAGPVFKRPILGGKLHARVRARGGGPVLVSVQSGAFAADGAAGGAAPIEPLAVAADAIVPDREILRVEEAAADTVDLSQAPAIVAIGRGIGKEENMPLVRELAEALGAEIGASRPVIDSGWLPRDRQIGSSGQTVAPKLYVAAGISGAIQHLVGMKGAQVVVAINKDASAPIFSVARYGVVGDLMEILPALTAAIREAKAAG